jgi:hypothetical protein
MMRGELVADRAMSGYPDLDFAPTPAVKIANYSRRGQQATANIVVDSRARAIKAVGQRFS